MPDSCSYNIRMHFRFLKADSSAFENKIVSSACCRDTIPPLLKSPNRPLTKPLLTALSIILDKPSLTRLKRMEDRGSPCLKPFPGLKKELSSPLTKIPKKTPNDYLLNPLYPKRIKVPIL
jgi:hypothetical protein